MAKKSGVKVAVKVDSTGRKGTLWDRIKAGIYLSPPDMQQRQRADSLQTKLNRVQGQLDSVLLQKKIEIKVKSK